MEWIRELNLNSDDRELIHSPTGWLNDTVVDALNKLVAAEIGGMRSSRLCLRREQVVSGLMSSRGYKSYMYMM